MEKVFPKCFTQVVGISLVTRSGFTLGVWWQERGHMTTSLATDVGDYLLPTLQQVNKHFSWEADVVVTWYRANAIAAFWLVF